MKKTELEKMGQENGTVEHDGDTIYLTQQAYVSDDGQTYRSRGVDIDDNGYRITWINLYADHRCGHDGNCAVEGCNGWCEDESNACDWDNPLSVELL